MASSGQFAEYLGIDFAPTVELGNAGCARPAGEPCENHRWRLFHSIGFPGLGRRRFARGISLRIRSAEVLADDGGANAAGWVRARRQLLSSPIWNPIRKRAGWRAADRRTSPHVPRCNARNVWRAGLESKRGLCACSHCSTVGTVSRLRWAWKLRDSMQRSPWVARAASGSSRRVQVRHKEKVQSVSLALHASDMTETLPDLDSTACARVLSSPGRLARRSRAVQGRIPRQEGCDHGASQGARRAVPDERKSAGARVNACTTSWSRSPVPTGGARARRSRAQAHATRIDVTQPGRGSATARASVDASRTPYRAVVPQCRFHRRKRSRDRGRLVQLRGAQYPGESSGARDARYVSTSPTGVVAHAYSPVDPPMMRDKPPLRMIVQGRSIAATPT